MIFLDTCVWIELLSVRTPEKTHEKRQAAAASKLLEEILRRQEKIVTCKEQMLELISAIEKVTLKSVNRTRRDENLPGIGNLKEFRKQKEFQNTKRLCKSVIDDLQHFANVCNIENYNINCILERLELADINDCLYYDYCVNKGIKLYTFDSDLTALGNNQLLYWYDTDVDAWASMN